MYKVLQLSSRSSRIVYEIELMTIEVLRSDDTDDEQQFTFFCINVF